MAEQPDRRLCPSPDDIERYLLRQGAAPDSAVLRGHLKGCPHCQRELGIGSLLLPMMGKPVLFHDAGNQH